MTRALLVGAVSTADRQQDPENQLRPLRAQGARKSWDCTERAFRQSRWDDDSAAEVRAAIMDELKQGEYDVLAVWSWDRVSRQGVEAAFSFLRELEDHLGVRFFSLQEPFLCTEAPKEQRELMLSILAWSAKWESQRKSDRLTAKAVAKVQASAKLGQAARWGGGKLATPEQVGAVLVMRATTPDLSIRKVAARVGLSKSQVARILAGEVKSAVPVQAPGQAESAGEKGDPARGGGPGQSATDAQNKVPSTIGPARPAEMPARKGAVLAGEGA